MNSNKKNRPMNSAAKVLNAIFKIAKVPTWLYRGICQININHKRIIKNNFVQILYARGFWIYKHAIKVKVGSRVVRQKWKLSDERKFCIWLTYRAWHWDFKIATNSFLHFIKSFSLLFFLQKFFYFFFDYLFFIL